MLCVNKFYNIHIGLQICHELPNKSKQNEIYTLLHQKPFHAPTEMEMTILRTIPSQSGRR